MIDHKIIPGWGFFDDNLMIIGRQQRLCSGSAGLPANLPAAFDAVKRKGLFT
ncbi:hypothetical protein SBDP1_90026 [Syntrophobacter sp. SbD1]|nr:hypothetical protein SBDP1_90026 [Syntrophobacter sp. SbD1]